MLERPSNPYWASYEEAIEEARVKIAQDVLESIGYTATRGNSQPPDEDNVRSNAASAFQFFTDKLDEFYPERSAESEQHIKRFIDAVVRRILTPGNTTVH